MGNQLSTADCNSGSSSSSSGGLEGPLLSQSSNPVHGDFNSARSEWNASKADIVLSYQLDNGGWPKNNDYDELDSPGSGGSDNGTIDNGATTTEMIFLAERYRLTGESKYRDAVRKGMEWLLDAQYDNGGWPQFWPLEGGYKDHATYNDDAMVKALTLLHHAVNESEPFASDIFNDTHRAEMQVAINLGVDYILKSQYKRGETLTAWCAQHGRYDYAPKLARSYELPSLSGSESVGVVTFLMTQPQAPQVVAAIEAALAWFRSADTYLADHSYDKTQTGAGVSPIVSDPGAKMWLRFYELSDNQAMFVNRDGTVFRDITLMDAERKDGYRWGGDWPEDLLDYAESVGY